MWQANSLVHRYPGPELYASTWQRQIESPKLSGKEEHKSVGIWRGSWAVPGSWHELYWTEIAQGYKLKADWVSFRATVLAKNFFSSSSPKTFSKFPQFVITYCEMNDGVKYEIKQ